MWGTIHDTNRGFASLAPCLNLILIANSNNLGSIIIIALEVIDPGCRLKSGFIVSHSVQLHIQFVTGQETWCACHLSCKTGEGKMPGAESATSVVMTVTMFS